MQQHPPIQPDRPAAPADPDERTIPIVNAVVRAMQVFQLVGGAVLVAMLAVYTYLQTRQGYTYPFGPAWLIWALPAAVTAIWLVAAAFNVRQLWRVWREWRHRHDDD